MNSITHFSPPHELRREEMVIRSYEKCKLCQQEVLPGVVYRCERPKYLVHRSCAQLPWHLRHPLHPDHTLTQFDIAPDSKSCSVCHEHFGGCAYRCSECEFVLNLPCAALKPSRIRGPELKINHQHPVTAFDKPKDHKYSCFICGEPFGYYQAIYFCSEYKRLMHESCLTIPQTQIERPFHRCKRSTTLTFLPRTLPERLCNLCGQSSWRFLFQCSSCNYCEDLDCANLVSTVMDFDRPDHGYIEVQPTSHDHRLIQCNNIKNFKRNCSGCGLPFHDSIYVCLHCRALLHESCANMPEKVIHSFHPQHCLTLFHCSSSLVHASVFCRACGDVPKNLIYMCQKCDFSLDIKCATAKHPLIRSEIHQHDLAYFNYTTKVGFSCNTCHRYSSNSKYFFRFVECNFNIHVYCYLSLPETIKHDCHLDPLTLTTSPIKDMPDEDENAEFYCNACEERRDLADPTYYCEECHFVAHFHCVFSEILPQLRNEFADSAVRSDNLQLETSMTVVSGEELRRGGYSEASGNEEAQLTYTSSDLIPQASATTEGVQNKNEDNGHKLNEEIALLENGMHALAIEIVELEGKLRELKHRQMEHRATLQSKQFMRDVRFGKKISRWWVDVRKT